MENIPEQLFDLLNQKDYNELTAHEKTLVSVHMDEHTYTDLRNASKLSHQFISDTKSVTIKPKYLQELLHKAETKYISEQTFVWNKPVALWKVAALFLVLSGGWLTVIFANKNQEVHTSYITQLDTIFVERDNPGEKIHDTVYIEYERKKQYRQTKHERMDYVSNLIRDTEIQVIRDVNIVDVKEKDEPINSRKGNSIKDDSLIKAFGFVTL